ncbi:MAG TPA: ABC transporter substrate-binding protein [Acidiphilium sp.]
MTVSRRQFVTTAATGAIASSALVGRARAATPLKIGILNDQSGVYADFGGKGSVAAAKIAVQDFGGSVLGRPIEIVDADHQNKPALASSIARRWYTEGGVSSIMELTTSSCALAVQALSKDMKKIDIVTGAATTELTGSQWSPYGFHWAYDTHSQAVCVGGALVKHGGKTWFFITVDYAFGHSLQAQTTRFVVAKGGKVVGSVLYPLGTTDYSSYLLRAKASGAQVIGLANAGLDTINALKGAAEFQIVKGGQKLAALLFTLSEVHGLGLQQAQGTVLAEAYYWDLNDKTRAFGNRYLKKFGRMPNMVQAGTYSCVLQYLKAVKDAGTDDTETVSKHLHSMPVNDEFCQNGKVLANGSMIHDMYLFQVKSPAESKSTWDYYKTLDTIPGTEAFETVAESGCKCGVTPA